MLGMTWRITIFKKIIPLSLVAEIIKISVKSLLETAYKTVILIFKLFK